MTNETKQPTVVGGINLSTRTKSKTFWVAIISAVAVFANQITGAFGLDYSAQIEQGVNIVGSILTLLAGLGIIVDNNTKGIKDSEIVQTDYTKPRDSKDPNEFVQWQNDSLLTDVTPERKEKEPEEFDTSQPFTDDSDEVEFDVAEYEDDEELPRGASKFHDDSVLKDGKEDESVKDDFVENIDDVVIDDSVNSNKEDTDKVVKKTVTKEVTDDKKESDK